MIDINCDLGEGIGNEKNIMPWITSANIACGGHAGDVESINKSIDLALEYNVNIGAHPSYEDKINFGRISHKLSEYAFKYSIESQISVFLECCEKYSCNIHHIKPHGALYHDLRVSSLLSNWFIEIIDSFGIESSIIFTAYPSELALLSKKRGYDVWYEVFIDRTYDNNYNLISRKLPNSLIEKKCAIKKRILNIIENNCIYSVHNKCLSLPMNTGCVHSDTKNVVEILQLVNHIINRRHD